MQDISDETSRQIKVQRFIDALNHALTANRWTQRRLCEELQVTIGTMTKYLRGSVHPERVGFKIQARLAKALGQTVDALDNYYETGEYNTDVTFEQVVAYCNSQIKSDELPVLLSAVSNKLQSRKHVEVPYKSPAEISHTDEEARIMADDFKRAFVVLRDKSGLNDRRTWSKIEEQLEGKGLAEDEIDAAYEVILGDLNFNGKLFTMMHRQLCDRFLEECPVVTTFKELGVESQILERAARVYQQVV